MRHWVRDEIKFRDRALIKERIVFRMSNNESIKRLRLEIMIILRDLIG